MIDAGAPLRFFYPKEGGFLHVTTIDAVASTKHPKEAQMWINYVLDPLSQLGHAYEVPYGPTNKTLAAVLAAYPDVSKKFPVLGSADAKLLTTPNWQTVFDEYPSLVENWNRIVKSH
jgi:putative spermidine/putrescine transport system substrate-binding protein